MRIRTKHRSQPRDDHGHPNLFSSADGLLRPPDPAGANEDMGQDFERVLRAYLDALSEADVAGDIRRLGEWSRSAVTPDTRLLVENALAKAPVMRLVMADVAAPGFLGGLEPCPVCNANDGYDGACCRRCRVPFLPEGY
jgi:hypothetical protein